jgi:hypothetical protein
MKKIVLISSYCDTEEKILILKKNLKIYKELGLDTLLISPIKLQNDVIDLCDFYFYTKENPILCWPERAYSHWLKVHTDIGQKLTIHRGHCDYGWAALYQTKKLFEIGLILDYDILIHTIYDIHIDDFVKEKLQSDEDHMIFTRRDPHNPETLWESTLHLLIVNRDIAEKITKYIIREAYTSSLGFAESHVLIWKNEFGLKSSEQPVKDEIFYWEGYDHFNYSKNPKYKIFMAKNTDTDSEFTILLTLEDLTSDFKISVNDSVIETEKVKVQFFKTGIHVDDVKNFKVIIDENIEDYIDIFNEISRNVINEGWD